MAFLHGSWVLQPQRGLQQNGAEADVRAKLPVTHQHQSGSLFLWGEVWRHITPAPLEAWEVQPHPYAMTRAELLDWLTSLQQAGSLRLPIEHLLEQGELAKSGKRSRKGATAVAAPIAIASPQAMQWKIQAIALPAFVKDAPDLPAIAVLPWHSATTEADSELSLYPWQIEGLCLDTPTAIALLNSLPLSAVSQDTFTSGDLRFWSHIARWSLDLLARAKVLPALELGDDNAGSAHWQPLLDSSADQLRLAQLIKRMPAVCRMYQSSLVELPEAQATALATPLPIEPQVLLQSFLSTTLDAQMRAIAAAQPLPAEPVTRIKPPRQPAEPVAVQSAIAASVQPWLQALRQTSPELHAPGLKALGQALTTWTTPLQTQGFQQSLFRTCLYLHPPQQSETQWQLEYFLQAVDDHDFLVSASTIWNHPVEQLRHQGRTIPQPQETFLMGLGLASRLCPPIEPSLQAARPQFCQLTPLQAYDFIKSTAWRLQDSGLGVIMPESLAKQGGWANRLGLKIQAQTRKLGKGQRLGLQSLLNFRWELAIGGQTLSKEQFDRLVALNTPLVEINGEWVELRPSDVRAAQTFFASRKNQPSFSLEDALRISTGDTQMIEKLPVVGFEAAGQLQDLINTLTGNRTLEAVPEPVGFQGELRPYQARGVGWLAFLEQWGLGACLADDMGLGKTIQLIAFLLHLRQHNQLESPILLVCPTSVLGNWEREVKRFAPDLTLAVHHGDSRAKGKEFAKAMRGQALVITSYPLVQRDLKDLQTVTWQGVVLDEAQNIKNSEAKQSQAIRQLEAQFRIALTGTPVENRLSELWSIMDFLNPNYLGPKNFFQRRFATPIERYGDTDSLKTLRSLVQPFILRRLKTDRDIIQDLPEKQETTVFCGLTNEQAALYQGIVDKSLAEIEAAEGIQRHGIILALLVKLKQICNHPALFLKEAGEQEAGDRKQEEPAAAEVAANLAAPDSPASVADQAAAAAPTSPTSPTFRFQARSGKLQRLGEMLEEVVLEGDRALIFTQFAEWGKLLKAQLEGQLGQEVLFLYGSTSKKNREAMIDRFQHDPQAPRIFILSLKAGGVGLNLTRANHVFHFDRWWNPAVENQATDRVFRIGQTRNVQVHKFVCTGTLEEKIHDLIESKKALAEQVVGTGESWLTDLDAHQLRDLLLLDRRAIIGEE